MDSSFISATLLLFLVLDPFGNTPVVAAVLRGVPAGRKVWVVLRECLIAYGVLLGFLFFGKHLLGVLQLSPTSLGIAGGVMLFLIALRMIFPMAGGMFGEVAEGETLTLAMLMSTLTLVLAARLEEFLGDRVMTALGRLMGFVLSILAVEMLLEGFRTFAKSL